MMLKMLCVCVCAHSVLSDSATTWTMVHYSPQALLSMEFSRQEYWSGLPFPPPGNLPNPGTEPRSPALNTDSFPLSHWKSPQWQCDLPQVVNFTLTLNLCFTFVNVSPLKKPLNMSSGMAGWDCSVRWFDGRCGREREMCIFLKLRLEDSNAQPGLKFLEEEAKPNSMDERKWSTLQDPLILMGTWPPPYLISFRTVESFRLGESSQHSASRHRVPWCQGLLPGPWLNSLCNLPPSQKIFCSSHTKLCITP